MIIKKGGKVLKIVIFGTGNVGDELLSFPLQKNCCIVLVVDNDQVKWGMNFHGYAVESPEKINEIDYDYILIANAKFAYDIWNQLIHMGIEKSKILFPYGWDYMEYGDTPLDEFFSVKKKELLPFRKHPAEIFCKYEGETSRSYARRKKEGFFDKYCSGDGLDIGYGSDPITSDCSGWDRQHGDAQYLDGIEDESFDYVYSSHCLEHMNDVRIALKNWFRVVRRGGYLLLAVPHRDLYEKKNSLPSRWNFDHKHMFLIGKTESPDTLDIVEEIRESLVNYDIKYVKACDEGHTITDPTKHSDGEYQIEVVIQKM